MHDLRDCSPQSVPAPAAPGRLPSTATLTGGEAPCRPPVPSSPALRTPSRTERPATHTPENAFRPEFLARLAAAGSDLAGSAPARATPYAGPWHVERTRAGGFAVLRLGESLARGDLGFGVFASRDTAVQVAAVLPLVGCGASLRLGETCHPAGYTLHRHGDFLGQERPQEPALLPYLEMTGALLGNPLACAQLLTALAPDAASSVGGLLARLVGGGGA